MSYNELSVYGRLRKVEKCGPYSMFGKLLIEWGTVFSPAEVSLQFSAAVRICCSRADVADCEKGQALLVLLCCQPTQDDDFDAVGAFREWYSPIHLSSGTCKRSVPGGVLTCKESYSPDDNRFDLRPFLYNAGFNHQFKKIDDLAGRLPDRSEGRHGKKDD